MPFLHNRENGKENEPIKVACPSCIDGHRSPNCWHLDRILVQVRQPGRPRVHCTHGKASWGSDRCRICYPTIAYVVPGHGASHLRKPTCQQERDQPIKDWEQTTPEEAEKHEADRARMLEGKRAARRKGQPQSCCAKSKSKAAATSHGSAPNQSASSASQPAVIAPKNEADSAAPSQPTTPLIATPGASSLGAGSLAASSPQTLTFLSLQGDADRRQALTPYHPGQYNAHASTSNDFDCTCGDAPGQCNCLGCPRHPGNQATHDFANMIWAQQESPQQGLDDSHGQRGQLDQGNHSLAGQQPLGEHDFDVYTTSDLPTCTCGPECSCEYCPLHGNYPSSSTSAMPTPQPRALGGMLTQNQPMMGSSALATQPAFGHGAPFAFPGPAQSLDYMNLSQGAANYHQPQMGAHNPFLGNPHSQMHLSNSPISPLPPGQAFWNRQPSFPQANGALTSYPSGWAPNHGMPGNFPPHTTGLAYAQPPQPGVMPFSPHPQASFRPGSPRQDAFPTGSGSFLGPSLM